MRITAYWCAHWLSLKVISERENFVSSERVPSGIYVELVRNLLAHAQKPVFVFRLNGRVHLNRRGSQFSRLLAAEMCASALVMLDTLHPEIVWEYWLPTPFASFPFTSPSVRHHVPPHSERSIPPYRFDDIKIDHPVLPPFLLRWNNLTFNETKCSLLYT